MNAAFLLLTSAWLTGADACCGGCCAAPCGDCCGCCCRPTLRERFDAFRNACGSPQCGCCGDCCGCCCRPSLRDRFDAFRNACGAPKCCNNCCTPCCDSCGGGYGAGHGAPMVTPIVPKGAEPIGLPKGKNDNKPMPEGGAAEAPLKIGTGVPQLEATPVANPKNTVIVEPETTKSPF